jgi:hypothetical protein
MKKEVKNSSYNIVLDKSFEECLGLLDTKQINKLYENLGFDEKKDIEGKKTDITESFTSFLMINSMTFTDYELDELHNFINGKEIDDLDGLLTKYNFIFEIDGIYYVPLEFVDVINLSVTEESRKDVRRIAISCYLESNGVLELDNFVNLLRLTGLNVSKKELKSILKDCDYEVINNRAYSCEVAKRVDNDDTLYNFKSTRNFKVFSLAEIFKNMFTVCGHNYCSKLEAILVRKIDNPDKLDFIVNATYDMIRIGGNYEENIDNMLDSNDVKLSKNEKKKLDKLITTIYQNSPSFELNGYYPYEIFDDMEVDDDVDLEHLLEDFESDESDDECLYDELSNGAFDYLTLSEKQDTLITIYLNINGIIRIDKLLDIINNYHNVKLTKKELITYVKKNEVLSLVDDCICIVSYEDDVDFFIRTKDFIGEYKVINDIEKFIESTEYNETLITNLCFSYGIKGKMVDYVLQSITVGIFSEDYFNEVCKTFHFKMSSKKIKEFVKGMDKITLDVNVWILNGFSKKEYMLKFGKSNKIGRNEKCSCGSGKKYKHCCGK